MADGASAMSPAGTMTIVRPWRRRDGEAGADDEAGADHQRLSAHRPDVVIGGLLVLAGAGVVIAALQQASGTASDPLGPRGFPALIGVALACSGVALLAQSALASRRRETHTLGQSPKLTGDEPDDGPASPQRLLAISLVTVGYVAVLPVAGFLASTPVALAAIMGLQGGVSRRTLVVMMVGFPLAIYGLFTVLLGVPLPTGSLFSLPLPDVVGG